MHRAHPRKNLSLTLVLLLAAPLGLTILATPAAAQAAVTMEKATYLDLDADGYLDAVRVDLSGNILDESVRPTDFTVAKESVLVKPYLACSVEPVAADCPGANDNNDVFYLAFPESLALTSGVLPQLIYGTSVVPGSLMTNPGAGASVPVSAWGESPPEEDGAPPVFWGAVAKAGGKEVILSFSEKVSRYNGATVVDSTTSPTSGTRTTPPPRPTSSRAARP